MPPKARQCRSLNLALMLLDARTLLPGFRKPGQDRLDESNQRFPVVDIDEHCVYSSQRWKNPEEHHD